MKTYVIKRLLQAIPVLLLIAGIVFFLLRLIPGDPAAIYVGANAEPGVVESIRKEMGLDQPLYVQFFIWISRVARGDFGTSIVYHLDVVSIILQRLPVTLILGSLSMVLALALAVPAGILASANQNSYKDYLFTLLAVLGISIPGFWLALMLVIFFSVKLGWFPATGYISPFENFLRGMQYLVLPCLSQALLACAIIARMTRSTMLEVLRQEFITTARGKGLPRVWVIGKHALKNAFAPTLTVIGFQLGNILGGAVITETIFSLPGIGQLVYNAIGQRDYPIIQGCILLVSFGFVLINLIVDLLYSYFDPRIVYEG